VPLIVLSLIAHLSYGRKQHRRSPLAYELKVTQGRSMSFKITSMNRTCVRSC